MIASAAAGGQVAGAVSASGGPVAGARVTLFVPSLANFLEERTGPDGTYMFQGVASGSYSLGVAAVGYGYVETVVTVGGGLTQQNFAIAPETHPGSWNIIGNTLPELFDATDIAMLLADGTVFFCHDTVDPIRFNPVTGQKTFPAGSASEQGCMNATLLEDGRIIMVGGQDGSDPGSFTDAIPWVKAYSPMANAWAQLPNLQLGVGRWYPGLARLNDGSLLAMGGGTAPAAARTDTCERFELATQTWSYTGSMLNPTEFPPTALLHTGEVLITWYPPQLYNPQSGEWRATGGLVQPARGWPNHSDHSLVVLSDGRALAIGIRKVSAANNAMGEIYDPVTETWSLTSSPQLLRLQPEVVQLPDGRVLVAAGENEAEPPPVPNVLGVVKWCDLYNPALNTWRRVADMNQFREYHAVTLLVPDGRVLTTGGTRIQFQYGPTSADIEAFSPPYLFRGVRPSITSISTSTPARGTTVTVSIAPQTQITAAVLIGTPTTTHWVEGGIPRRLVLPVTQQGSTMTVTLPSDPNVLPLGHYMLFAMVDDIPSAAKIIRVVPAPSADFNGDGVVDGADLGTLLGSWGTCDATCPTDLNGDGAIDGADLGILLGSWS